MIIIHSISVPMSAGHQWLQLLGTMDINPCWHHRVNSLHLNDSFARRKSEQDTLYSYKSSKVEQDQPNLEVL